MPFDDDHKQMLIVHVTSRHDRAWPAAVDNMSVSVCLAGWLARQSLLPELLLCNVDLYDDDSQTKPHGTTTIISIGNQQCSSEKPRTHTSVYTRTYLHVYSVYTCIFILSFK